MLPTFHGKTTSVLDDGCLAGQTWTREIIDLREIELPSKPGS